MSALPPKADIAERNWDVCFVPIADIGPMYALHTKALSLIDATINGSHLRCYRSVNDVRALFSSVHYFSVCLAGRLKCKNRRATCLENPKTMQQTRIETLD